MVIRKPEHSASTAHLFALCDKAADLIAEAHRALADGPEEAEQAIANLDSALDCLKRCELKR